MNSTSPIDTVSMRQIDSKGLSMRVAEQGEGPAVLFLHGWPESWYSWRHQLAAVAAAGYRGIAPDMPGYGGTDSLPAIDDYNIKTIASHVVGVLDALGIAQAILVGHDWGAAIAWGTIQLYPERFSALVNMSVPYRPHAPAPPMQILKRRFGDRFFYQLYFQKPGVAEAEFDADPRAILSRLYCSPNTFRMKPVVEDKDYRAGGWIPRLGEPKELPAWITPVDIDYYVEEFSRKGFHGGINYYRNIDRNWELLAPFAQKPITQPVLFIAGDKDMVIGGASAEDLKSSMAAMVPNLKDVVLFPGIGHWVQQEAATETNEALLSFIKALNT